jgi:hypothetical protein
MAPTASAAIFVWACIGAQRMKVFYRRRICRLNEMSMDGDILEHDLSRLLQQHPAGLSSRRIGAILNKPAHVVMGRLVVLQKEGKAETVASLVRILWGPKG